MVKNRIKALLGKENLNYPVNNLFGKSCRDWLEGQVLSEDKEIIISVFLKILDFLNLEIEELDKEIKKRGSSIPEVKLLTTIPGIGIMNIKSPKRLSPFFYLRI